MSWKNLEAKIDAYIAENKENIINDITTLVKYPSVSADAVDGAPFGLECKKVLDKALEMCEGYGFATKNYDYYAGSASIGDKEKEISIMGHLDIVPVGDGWSNDPYTVVEKEGYLYGRGVDDDKGPLVLGLYALRFLKEHNIPLNYTYRLVMGCNEETGMSDVAKLLEMEKTPTFMFTPDAGFPVINGEKGIMGATCKFTTDGAHIVNFCGGSASNIVNDYCTATLKGIKKEDLGELCPCKFEVVDCECGCGVKLSAKGVASHAAAPANSTNAIYLLAEKLSTVEALTEAERECMAKIAATLADYNGVGLGIDCEDEPSGKITHVSGIASQEGDVITLDYNIRYPVLAKGCELKERLENHAKAHGFVGEVYNDSKPSYRAADTAEVKALLNAYIDVTGNDATPLVMGGGTYARKFPNAVAFGPGFPGTPNPAGAGKGGAHQIDECICIENMWKALKVYIAALLNLNELEL